MASAMLRDLGESKFTTLQNELARGKAPLALARTIRSQWGDFREFFRCVARMQLTRLRKHMALGKMGKQVNGTIRGQQQTRLVRRGKRLSMPIEAKRHPGRYGAGKISKGYRRLLASYCG
jgi:hypothetical protein